MRDFYIYFNVDTEEIVAVCPCESSDFEGVPYITVDYNIGSEFILGTRNVKDWIVMADDNGQFSLVKSIQYVTVPTPKVLDHFPQIKIYKNLEEAFNAQLIITVNKISKTLTVLVNKNSLFLRAKRRSEFNIKGLETLNIYVTMKNNPYGLIKSLDIDMKTLLENGFVTEKIDDLLEDFSVFMPNVFDKTALILIEEDIDYETIASQIDQLGNTGTLVDAVTNNVGLPVLNVEFLSKTNNIVIWMPFVYRILLLRLGNTITDFKLFLEDGSELLVPGETIVSTGFVILRNPSTSTKLKHFGSPGLVRSLIRNNAEIFGNDIISDSSFNKLTKGETCIVKNFDSSEILILFSKEDIAMLDSTKDNTLFISDARDPLVIVNRIILDVNELKIFGRCQLNYDLYKDNKIQAYLQCTKENLRQIEVIEL